MAVVAKMQCVEATARATQHWVACAAEHPDAQPLEAFNGWYGLAPWLEGAEAIRPVTGHGSTDVSFKAVSAQGEKDDPNREWAAYTPAGALSMTINNPSLLRHFEPGVEYRVTIEKIRRTE